MSENTKLDVGTGPAKIDKPALGINPKGVKSAAGDPPGAKGKAKPEDAIKEK